MIPSLPSEILIKIAHYLQPDSLINLTEINERWSHIARKSGIYRLDFSKMTGFQSESTMITYTRNEIPAFAEGATVKHLWIVSPQLVPDNVFLFLQQLCPNVNSFNYDPKLLDTTIASNRHTYLLSYAWQKSITHLSACFCVVKILPFSVDLLCRRLENLYIGEDGFDKSSSWTGSTLKFRNIFPKLTVLTIDAVCTIDQRLIRDIHSRCPQLSNLTLRNVSLYLSTTTSYTKIQTLKLENVTFSHCKPFDFLSKIYPNVTTLTVSTNQTNFPDLMNHSSGNSSNLSNDCLNHKSVRECLYEMIVSFKRMSKVIIHFNGFGEKEDSLNIMYQDHIKAHFSTVFNKDIQVQVTYS